MKPNDIARRRASRPDKPMALQPVAYNGGHHDGMPGIFDIGDAAPPAVFCGRGCLFDHSVKHGINVERAERVSAYASPHEWRGEGTAQIVHTAKADDGDYHVGYRISEAHEAEDIREREPQHQSCDNCGRAL